MAEGDAPDGPEGGKDSEGTQDAGHTSDASTGPGTPAADSEPTPLREDQIQNAMAFLSHPKVCSIVHLHAKLMHTASWVIESGALVTSTCDVRLLACTMQVQGSTADAKRSFLERKGLTQPEIDEAVRRVPLQAATALQAPSGQAAGVHPNSMSLCCLQCEPSLR